MNVETAPSNFDQSSPEDTTNPFVEPEHEVVNWDDIGNPVNALRFRDAVAVKLSEQGIPATITRGQFAAHGVITLNPIELHATASYFGVTDEQWLEQLSGEAEYIPAGYVKQFDALLKNRSLDAMAKRYQNEHMRGAPIEPMKIVTEHDRLMSMSTDQLDYEIRTAHSPQEQARLINNYMLPRVDEQDRWLRTKEASADEDEADTAQAIIADIESRLKDMGIERASVIGEKYDPRSHAIVKTVGSGPYWIVAEELRPGYMVGNSSLRPASVSVIRMNQAQYDDYRAERKKQRQKAKNLGKTSLKATGTSAPNTEAKPDDTDTDA